MNLDQLFAAVEASQKAKASGADQVTGDQNKLASIQAQLATDTANQVTLVASADSDINALIAGLQLLLSTAATVPVPAP
jgi:hypothetical protein